MPPEKKRKSALETAAGILGARAYTKLELRRKLYKKERFTPSEIERAVAELERMGFLSDRRYCEDAVRILRGRGYGPLRIRSRLLSKGVPRDIVEECLETAEPGAPEDDAARALSLLERSAARFGREDDPRRKRAKALRFLAGRGFAAESAFRALEQWEHGACDETE